LKQHYSSIISQIFGKFASREFNSKTQKIINISYVKLMGLDMREFKKPDEYCSLNALFTRELKKQRFIDKSTTSVISPCDSTVVDFGKITDNRAYQIKGMSYNISELLGNPNLDSIELLSSGEYINFYLSPKDYHRYHMPFDAEILSLLYIPGKLYPVNMPLLKNKTNLYIENERVVIKVKDRFNHIHFIILVGALNVGKMVVTFEPKVETNTKSAKEFYIQYQEPIKLSKADMFGYFKMGSTIVILSQKDSIKWNVELMEHIKYSKVIGELQP